MNLREQLRQAISGMPEGGAITLPVEAVRRWLREDLEEAGDVPTSQKTYSTTEAAKMAGVKPSTVAEWAKDGRLPNAWKTGADGGGEWRIREADLLALMTGQKNETDRVRLD